MAGKKKRTGKPRACKVEQGFVAYGGYIPELDMFLNEEGEYFKMYVADMGEACDGMGMSEGQRTEKEQLMPEKHTDAVLRCRGFRLQVIAMKGKSYILLGTRAENPETAESRFQGLEGGWPYQAVSCEEWFHFMSERLRFEPFVETMEESGRGWRKGKAARIDLVQPYNVRKGQKEMELSGRTVKTVLLMGYPSRLFEAFATELLEIRDNLVLTVYAEELDPKRCLDGVNLSGEIKAARKAAMKIFLEEVMRNETRIYNTCALVAMDGLPGEVEDTFQALKRFCGKYLISLSELDYQQADAWRSALPLMKNRIRYYRVLTEQNLKALFPWSELKRCKRTVCYGTDVMNGEVSYDRRIHRENGFILSGNYDWAMEQAIKEMGAYGKASFGSGESISILADKCIDTLAFGAGEGKELELTCDSAPKWLLKAVIVRWAVNGLSTNGRTMKKHIDMVMKAAEGMKNGKGSKDIKGGENISAESIFVEKLLESDREIPETLIGQETSEKLTGQGIRDKQKTRGKQKTEEDQKAGEEQKSGISDYVGQFLSQMGEQEQRALSLRPFNPICRYQVAETLYGNIYQVMETGVQAEIAYALMFWRLHGIVYSLNSELLAWNLAGMYRLHKDTMYTFLTRDNRTLYESRNFSELFQKVPFLLLGEHGIFEKLRLSETVGLDKEQRKWISEPAKGAVLMTKLAVYQLKGEGPGTKKRQGDRRDG